MMGWEMIYPTEQEKQLERVERILKLSGHYVLGLRARLVGVAIQIRKDSRDAVIEMMGEPIHEGDDTRNYGREQCN